jgi:hypothetical protein
VIRTTCQAQPADALTSLHLDTSSPPERTCNLPFQISNEIILGKIIFNQINENKRHHFKLKARL